MVDGPGSFTGVRVGLSAAKGLCEALEIGLVAVSRLELVAGPASERTTAALLDAGRDEFYCGVYRYGFGPSERLVGRERVAALSAEQARLVTCEPKVACALAQFAVELVDEPCPSRLLTVAMHRIAARQWSDVAAVDANYLRRPDAEAVLARKMPGGAA